MSRDIDAAVAAIQAAADKAIAEIRATAFSETIPEPVADHIEFTKRFAGTRRYRYAAISYFTTGGVRRWSVTGKENLTSVPWHVVAAFIARDEGALRNGVAESITEYVRRVDNPFTRRLVGNVWSPPSSTPSSE